MTTYTKIGTLQDLYKGTGIDQSPHVKIGGSEATVAPVAIVSLSPLQGVPDWYQVRLEGEREPAHLPADTSVYCPSTETVQIDWMESGQEMVAQAGGKAALLAEIDRLTWHPLPCRDVPFMQGYALGHLIKEVVHGQVRRIAWDGLLCERYDLIGIEAEYKNGAYRHYWADTGTGLVPLATVPVELTWAEWAREGKTKRAQDAAAIALEA